MAEFNFIQDVKLTIWQRQHFSIEADSYEEAKEKAAKYADLDVSSDGIVTDSEYLSETEELMSLEENDFNPTIEVFEEDDLTHSLYSNKV